MWNINLIPFNYQDNMEHTKMQPNLRSQHCSENY